MISGWVSALSRLYHQANVSVNIKCSRDNHDEAGDIDVMINVNQPMKLMKFFPPGVVPEELRQLQVNTLLTEVKASCQPEHQDEKITRFTHFYHELLSANLRVDASINFPVLDKNDTVIIFLFNGTDQAAVRSTLGNLVIKGFKVIPIYCPAALLISWSDKIELKRQSAELNRKSAELNRQSAEIERLRNEIKELSRTKEMEENEEEDGVEHKRKGKRSRKI